MERKPCNAFITARKGFCYLTIRSFGRNHEMMRIRNYRIDPEEKRHMRRLYPDVAFDWKKITEQLAEKRDACRRYRARRRNPNTARAAHGCTLFFGVCDPGARTLYANGVPCSAAGVGALLDAVLLMDRSQQDAPNAPSPHEPVHRRAHPNLTLVKAGSQSER